RGIDLAAKFSIYHLIDDLAARGKGIVVASSEVEELMLLCDRIAVLSAGRLVEVFERGSWSQENLLAAAFAGVTGSRQREESEFGQETNSGPSPSLEGGISPCPASPRYPTTL